MHRKTKNRLWLLMISMILIASGVCIVLYNLEKSIVFFLPPSEVHKIEEGREFRVGGVVKKDSIANISSDEIQFVITDEAAELEVMYKGVVPALFRERQGIVAIGKLFGNMFIAQQLLTKHDENYYPSPSDAKSK